MSNGKSTLFWGGAHLGGGGGVPPRLRRWWAAGGSPSLLPRPALPWSDEGNPPTEAASPAGPSPETPRAPTSTRFLRFFPELEHPQAAGAVPPWGVMPPSPPWGGSRGGIPAGVSLPRRDGASPPVNGPGLPPAPGLPPPIWPRVSAGRAEGRAGSAALHRGVDCASAQRRYGGLGRGEGGRLALRRA